MTKNYEFGNMVRTRREGLKLSREQLAEKCCISDRCICNIELGNSLPKIDTVLSLCYHCNIDVGELSVIQKVMFNK